MKLKMFAQPALMDFQGEYVFNLLQRYPDHAEFTLEGFGEDVIIYDYRPITREAVDRLLSGELGETDFAPYFNTPALVSISSFEQFPLLITLKETNDPDPAYRFWVAIGIEDEVPAFHYIFTHIVPYGQGHYAFLSIHQQPERVLLPDYTRAHVSSRAEPASLAFSPNW